MELWFCGDEDAGIENHSMRRGRTACGFWSRADRWRGGI